MSKKPFEGILNQNLENESLSDKVYKLLEESIINMTLSPGHILKEEEIAKTLKISRSPVREALIRLENVGMVKKSHSWRAVVKINKKSVCEKYEAWEMIESFASGMSSQNHDKSNLSRIEEIIKEMDHVVKEPDLIVKYRDLNYYFHQSIVACCDNDYIKEMHKNVLNHIRWCYNFTLLDRDQSSSILDHRLIYKSYKARNRKEVEELARGHIIKARNRIVMKLGNI